MNEIEKLGVREKTILLFMNKDDIVLKKDREVLSEKFPGAIWGNTLTKDGVKELRSRMFEIVSSKTEANQ
jgi:50S ribosomal subunit-associated GTPase HflX